MNQTFNMNHLTLRMTVIVEVDMPLPDGGSPSNMHEVKELINRLEQDTQVKVPVGTCNVAEVELTQVDRPAKNHQG